MATLMQINRRLAEGPLNFKHLYETIIANGPKIAAEYDDEDGDIQYITYAQYGYMVRNCASHIQSVLGKDRRGEFVGVRWDTNPQYPVIVWSLLMAGFKPVLIDFRCSAAGLAHILKQTGATALITPYDTPLPDGVLSVHPSAVLKNHMALYFEEQWEDKIALCTSGTTETSRVFVYDGAAIIGQPIDGWTIIKARENFIYDGDIKVLAYLPMHHIFGFVALMVHFSVYGKVLVYPKDRSAATTMEACQKHGVTHIFNVPLFWNSINQGIWRKAKMTGKTRSLKALIAVSLFFQKFAPKVTRQILADHAARKIQQNLLGNKIRCLISGGGRVLPETVRTLNGLGYDLIIGFGMTELGITGVCFRDKIKDKLSLCCGEPLPSVEYRIAPFDPERPNVGELFVRSKTMHIGRMEEGKMVPPAVDADGWFTTGDIGRIDDRGYLWIEGRLKEVIVNESGENVYPDELEDAFAGLAHAEQLCVVGVADGKGYEAITLVIESRAALADSEKLKELAAIIAEKDGALPVFKKLRHVYLSLQPLPLANGIKVQRQKLKKGIESGGWPLAELDLQSGELKRVNADIVWRDAPAELPPSGTERKNPIAAIVKKVQRKNATVSPSEEYTPEFAAILAQVKELFSAELSLPVSEIGDKAHFIFDLGGDSLSSLGVYTRLEAAFGMTFTEEEFMRCNCALDVALLVQSKKEGGTGQEVVRKEEQRRARRTVSFADVDPDLQERIDLFLAEAERLGFAPKMSDGGTVLIPVVNAPAEELSTKLLESGYRVGISVREGVPTLLFTLTTQHTAEDIEGVLAALAEVLGEQA
ncbi:MAG: AMP-binding protein [Christensenellales bacterium]